jgi:hypothetical protein
MAMVFFTSRNLLVRFRLRETVPLAPPISRKARDA